MLTGIREKTVVKENGMVEISTPDLPVGTEVEVIVLVEEEEKWTRLNICFQPKPIANIWRML